MMDILNFHPTVVAIIVVVLTMLATSLIQWTFLIRLKRYYSVQWYHAGSPTIWNNESLIAAWPTVRYLQKQQYWSSGDPEGAAFCHRFRHPMVIGYWLTVVVFIAAVFIAILNGWPPSWK